MRTDQTVAAAGTVGGVPPGVFGLAEAAAFIDALRVARTMAIAEFAVRLLNAGTGLETLHAAVARGAEAPLLARIEGATIEAI